MPPNGVLDLRRYLWATEHLPLLAHAIETDENPAANDLPLLNTDAIWIMARPIGLVLSIAC
jgi:hypothetical protein